MDTDPKRSMLLEGVRSAPPDQTWLMQQMWSTHTAMELELWLLWQGMEYVFDQVFWVGEGERVDEQEGARERGVLEEAREEEGTME